MPAYKPLLSDFFKEVDLKDKVLLFEIKSEKEEYGISQPYPKEFVDLILAETKDFKMQENLIFMCFDPEILEELHKNNEILLQNNIDKKRYENLYWRYSGVGIIKNILQNPSPSYLKKP
jgi:glycerophosphoryl diester phosphodiesterase